ncbi:hypothetical protein E2C00_18450 [Streptomyces sp. WAC05374]|uniref:DUF6336 family protein n=1 Tax=Streptomyces sp. WAC05374 TaxID=2487420 RepID=UPI000F8758D8|nr:DUF6336 family protein [Streptomyces sp. WAC05374]RST10172.1 hypothetical protein EF905_27975 [Streptomyces sp. WAC05374]TDF47858.1 hypothetical protein E2C02_29385 [Streptomyces sp. WAC05374]TDF53991.1 hypothetical protein E2C00_18450 [Streptomyces sp. WAC05374]
MSAENEITQPLLRFRDVVARGALYGVAAVPLLGVASLFVADHNDRETFIAVVGGFALSLAAVSSVFGLFLWWASGGDIRRCRDWRTIRGQSESITVAAPVMVRLGVLGLVMFPGAFGLYHLVDAAEYGSVLYGG